MAVVSAAAAAVALILMPFMKTMLETSGATGKNYLGETIPPGMGTVFLPAVLSGSFSW